MRDDGCSFESPNNTSTSAQEKASIWSRAPGIPSWDQCFKCLYRCGIYSPPAEASGAGVKRCGTCVGCKCELVPLSAAAFSLRAREKASVLESTQNLRCYGEACTCISWRCG